MTWSVTYKMKLPPEMGSRSPYGKVQQVAYAETFERAIETADRFAKTRMGHENNKMYAV